MSKLLLITILISVYAISQINAYSFNCKSFASTELEGKRDVKFLLVLFRHGARKVISQSIWNKYFKTFDKKNLGKLDDAGKNQALLGGQNLKLNYPNFLKDIYVKDVKVEAKGQGRLIKSARNFADGLITNLRNLHMEVLNNQNSFPPYNLDDPKKLYCFKDSIIKNLIYHLDNPDTQDHSNPDWDIEKTGNDPLDAWEDHTYSLCQSIIQKRIEFRQKHEIMHSYTIKALKHALKNNQLFIDMFVSQNRTDYNLTWDEIMQMLDFCTNVNALQKEIRCDDEIMELINVMYNFKFYGINDQKQDRVFSSIFAKKYLDILSDFTNIAQTDQAPKVHLISKSDTLIAPFYNLLGLIPSRTLYLDAMMYNLVQLNIPDRPQFLDNFITEISERDNKYFIRLIRNGEPQMITTCGDFECELESFIKNTRKNILSQSDVKKQCSASATQRLLKTTDAFPDYSRFSLLKKSTS